MDLNGRFSRKILCLAAACACASAVHAGPAGPVVSAGRASYDAATLTLTSTTAHTQIGWQSFHVGASEVVNFIQPSAQSSVLNQIFNPQSLNILGSLRSNGSVLFMNSGRVSGVGLNLDLAGMISSSLRLPQMTLARSGSTLPAHPLTSLAEGSVYVISQDEQAVTTVKGDVLLNPGRSVELAHATMPALRVVLTAPDAESINLSRLVGDKRETGIFAGLFRIPAAARQAAQPEAGTILTARTGERGPDAAELERFYRYALLYAQMRHETLPHEGGMMRVAAAPGERIMLAAVKSRSSVLPREIEIGAPVLRARAPAAIQPRVPAPAASEQLLEKEQHQQFEHKDQKEETFNQLAMALELRPIPARAQNASASDIGRALAPLAPEVLSNLESQPISVALEAEPMPKSTTVLAIASAPLAPEVLSNLEAQPISVALEAEPLGKSATLLAMAPVQATAAPSETAQAPREAQAEAEPERIARRKAAPTVIVVAMAQHGSSPGRAEQAEVKELRIERRAPRYFTDFRGAMFFM